MTLPASLTVAGIECRRERRGRAYAGSRGRLRVRITPPKHRSDPVWFGYANVDPEPNCREASLIVATAFRMTPESCAATLTEIVRSVATALAGVGS